jgi:prefoldin subunit 5
MKTIEAEILEVINELEEIEKNIKHLEGRMSKLRLIIESIINVKQEVIDD